MWREMEQIVLRSSHQFDVPRRDVRDHPLIVDRTPPSHMTTVHFIRDHMLQQQPNAKPPYTEPEIIPPGADWPRASRIWVSTGPHHTTRIQITRLGPVAIALFVMLIGILALAGMALLLGAALVGIAVGGVLIVGGIVSSLSRRSFRR